MITAVTAAVDAVAVDVAVVDTEEVMEAEDILPNQLLNSNQAQKVRVMVEDVAVVDVVVVLAIAAVRAANVANSVSEVYPTF